MKKTTRNATISACLIIHNEEQLLPRCLKSLHGVVDEIIVAHDGPCTDKSLEIAKQFGAQTFILPSMKNPDPHRPFVIEKAKGDWVMQLDADEYLSDGLRRELRKLVNSTDIDGYMFQWPYFDGRKYLKGVFGKRGKPVLFRKSKIYYIGIPHEHSRTYGKLVKRLDLVLEHKPNYNNFSWQTFRTKWLKWIKHESLAIIHIDDAPTYNVTDKKTNATFQYYYTIRNHPWISCFKEVTKMVLVYIRDGLLLSNTTSWKISLQMVLVKLWLHYYVWKFSHQIEMMPA